MRSKLKTCPACAEDVKAEARVCRFCHHEFSTQPPRSKSKKGPIAWIVALLAALWVFNQSSDLPVTSDATPSEPTPQAEAPTEERGSSILYELTRPDEEATPAPVETPETTGSDDREDRVTVNTPACRDRDKASRALRLLSDDMEAFVAFIVSPDADGCISIDAGTPVQVEDVEFFGGMMCVRPAGRPHCYYVPREFVS